MSELVAACCTSGFLFEYFQLPLATVQDYYIFTLKPDDELPDGVSRSSFLAAAAAPAGGDDGGDDGGGAAVAVARPVEPAAKKQRTDGDGSS